MRLLRARDIRSALLLRGPNPPFFLPSPLGGHRSSLFSLLLRGSNSTFFLSPPLGRGEGLSFSPRLEVLADRLVAGLITILLAAYLLLLLHGGIPVPRILPLVDGQRGA